MNRYSDPNQNSNHNPVNPFLNINNNIISSNTNYIQMHDDRYRQNNIFNLDNIDNNINNNINNNMNQVNNNMTNNTNNNNINDNYINGNNINGNNINNINNNQYINPVPNNIHNPFQRNNQANINMPTNQNNQNNQNNYYNNMINIGNNGNNIDNDMNVRLIKCGNKFNNNDIDNIIKSSCEEFKRRQNPLSKYIIQRIKNILGGDWVVFICADGLKGYDLSVSVDDENRFIAFMIDNFRFQIIKIGD